MPTIKQHVLGYISGSENPSKPVEFNSIEELLNIDFVKAHDFNEVGMAFNDFSKTVIDDKEVILMAEYNGGDNWSVVGYIEGGSEILNDIPNWVPKIKQ